MKVIEKYLETRQQLFTTAGIMPEALTVNTKGPVKKVHYLKMGSGKPLILIHGGGSCSSEWFNILKPLAENYSLYVVDRPGSGLTDPFNYRNVDVSGHGGEFIRSFMDAVHLQRTSFLAQSMGAYFAMNFAMRYPKRTEKLICIGAPAGMNYYIPVPLRLMGTPVLNRILLSTVFKPSVDNVRKLYKMLFVANVSDIPKVYFEHISYHQLLPGWTESFFSLLENLLTWRGWKAKCYIGNKLEMLKVPVGFIWGDRDAFEKPDTGRTKANLITGHSFHVVQNAGHCPWFNNGEQCLFLIDKILNKQVQLYNNLLQEQATS
jgi:pimeloyl-ACP methyl ester carboxylesterase